MGGREKVDQMMQDFYQRVLMDSELAGFFASANIPKLIAMQQEFFAIALDGPIDYGSRRLIAAHHGRGITRQHFTRFCDHLLETLVAHGMDAEDADRVLARVAIYAGNVTGDAGVDG
jgi:hemoglobin